MNSDCKSFELRAAAAEDALCLSVLATQVYLHTYATQGIHAAIAREVLAQFSPLVFAELLGRTDTWFQVAEQQGHLIGFAQNTWGAAHALAPALPPTGRPAELARLYVQEPFTAQGVGTALLHSAEHAASARGCTVLWLTPWVHNHRALAFYARRGYTDCGATVHIIEGVSHGNRVFAKQLPKPNTQPLMHSSFYRFTAVPDPVALAAALRPLAQAGGLTGSIVVAAEGISGAVAGQPAALQNFEHGLQQPALLQGRLKGMAFKHSHCLQAPFARFQVNVKPEIVALGLPLGLDPPNPPHPPDTATLQIAAAAESACADPGLLSPQAWRSLLQRTDVVVLDNRNHFEYRLGHFNRALDPGVHNFRDFVAFVEQQAPAWVAAGRPVAMYCTGGIRCEKTAPWMRSLGLQVLQLEGGILNYFAQLPDAGRDWQGECFVFDNRIALNSQLQETPTTADAVFDAQHADEAWRLARARRLQSGGG